MKNETAFPAQALGGLGYTTGMTLRDYFAARAMQAISTNIATLEEPNWLAMAEDAYKMADAMLKAREA